MREWVASKGGHKRIDLMRDFGLTLEQFEAMKIVQDNKCAICRKEETAMWRGKKRELAVDHHHGTGAVRRLLCTNCNQGIGSFMEDPEILKKALEYLQQHTSVP
jgi:RNase P subunit RPR2